MSEQIAKTISEQVRKLMSDSEFPNFIIFAVGKQHGFVKWETHSHAESDLLCAQMIDSLLKNPKLYTVFKKVLMQTEIIKFNNYTL